ncbi:MAG: hypothetical protein JXA93_11300 [Anaerolineae bacterium]|nr:hypothetical protein [Anaerolineae bacterium]
MFDTTFLILAAILLGGGLLSGFLKARARDRCLGHFAGYHVTLERTDGRLVWGEMTLYPNALEMVYRSDVQDEHHVETSYVLYKDEFPRIQAIYRYCDEMGSEQWEKREQDLRASFHPGLGRRLRRRARNVANLALESASQAIGILVGQVQSSSSRGITSSGEDYLNALSQNLVGYVGTSYDPLLERYVGTRVVVEVTEGEVVYEHVGILKDYTAEFLEILDVHYPNQSTVQVRSEDCCEEQHLRVVRDGEVLHVANVGEQSLLLQQLRIDGQAKPLNAVLDTGDALDLHLDPDTDTEDVEIVVKIVRHLDWIVPRAHALIRHKAERYDPDQVFDIGFVLKLDRHREEEARYLQILERDPDDATSAVALGQILFQRGALDGAERWFRQALAYRERLPDGGKLAERQLRYIERKRTGRRAA